MPHDWIHFLNDCTVGSMWVSCSWFSVSADGGVCMFVMHKLYAYSNGFPHCGKTVHIITASDCSEAAAKRN
jgi:hypothetical protein